MIEKSVEAAYICLYLYNYEALGCYLYKMIQYHWS